MSQQEIQRERKLGAKWAQELPMEYVHAFIDAMVLGEFDALEFGFEDKPSGPFLSAAFDTAQNIEECDY
jgi:hypothetical protein